MALDSLGQYGEALNCLGQGKKLQRQQINAIELEKAYGKIDRGQRVAGGDEAGHDPAMAR